MTWNDFPWFALPAMLCWVAAGITVYKYRGISHVLMLLGTLIYAVFIGGLWVAWSDHPCAPLARHVSGTPSSSPP